MRFILFAALSRERGRLRLLYINGMNGIRSSSVISQGLRKEAIIRSLKGNGKGAVVAEIVPPRDPAHARNTSQVCPYHRRLDVYSNGALLRSNIIVAHGHHLDDCSTAAVIRDVAFLQL